MALRRRFVLPLYTTFFLGFMLHYCTISDGPS